MSSSTEHGCHERRCSAARANGRARGRRVRAAFTLIELLVVLVIIAVLATIVAPMVFRNVGDAKSAAAKSQIAALALSLDSYRLDNDRHPSSAQGLDALRTPPTTGELPVQWRGPYLARVVPVDPWGRPYVYIAPGRVNPQTFDLYSLGRDGVAGGDGEDADVTSWGGPLPAGLASSPTTSAAAVAPVPVLPAPRPIAP